jgi:hypothetical protein
VPSEVFNQRARVAALVRHRHDGDPDLADARRELAAARLTDYIQKVVGEAPPLSNEQREKLALLLRGGAAA